MCGGAKYVLKEKDKQEPEIRKVYFPQPFAKMPVLTDGGEVELVQWGIRKGEDEGLDAPQTGWARETSLKSDYWQRHNPTPVLIPVLEFSEKGKLPKSRWFGMPDKAFLMGLLITKPEKNLVYVVTNPAVGALAEIHDRMPLVVYDDFVPVDFAAEEQKEPKQQSLF